MIVSLGEMLVAIGAKATEKLTEHDRSGTRPDAPL